jgi:hypothetical protein
VFSDLKTASKSDLLGISVRLGEAPHPADLSVFRRLKRLVSRGHCSAMPGFGEHMRWVTCVTAPILLADVGDYRFRVFSLDLKRSDERIFGVHGDVVRLPSQLKPDGELHRHASSTQYLGHTFVDVQPTYSQSHKVCCAVIAPASSRGRR